MPFFTSSREKHLWIWTLIVISTIFSTLFIGQPLTRVLSDQNVQAIFFSLGMILTGFTIVVHGLKKESNKLEISLLLGITAVYVTFFLRLGISERSHLIEYSVLAIFIYKALLERIAQGKSIRFPGMIAIVTASLIGVFDECIQIILPNRVFDYDDIIFNCLAATLAIGSSILLTWFRNRKAKSKIK